MTDTAFHGSGSLDEALHNGHRLLAVDPEAAARQAREIIERSPVEGRALRLLAASLRRMGRDAEARQAELDAIAASSHNPVLVDAALAIQENRLNDAEHRLRPHLAENPGDAAAVRMLAEIAARVGALDDSERLLRHALELAPGFASARLKLSRLLYQQNRLAEAIVELDRLLEDNPAHDAAANSKAAALGRVGDYQEALRLYEQLLERSPDSAGIWMTYGHVLKTVGRLEDSISAYRRALDLDPRRGEVWWSLANLKIVKLGSADIEAMTGALEDPGLDDDARLHLHFALGKAFEDDGDFSRSFGHYSEGNRIRRALLPYDRGNLSRHVQRTEAVLTPEFLAVRAGTGSPEPDPIFIVGLPRAGSTLIEQILASHSQVEGTSELPIVPILMQRLSGDELSADPAALDPAALRELGEEYLQAARLHRKTDRPFFIDKLPNNWAHIGLIHLMLPNAKIIDARRHPLGCCFSNFKQHFAYGQSFTYSLADLGGYYSDYARLLAHFDSVMPGRIHRVFHEAMVEDSETEIRRLLDHLDLPFEEACLRFHENDRAVRTPSAEQVRRPINREGVERWKAYEPWLGPLKEALGAVLDRYPAVPEI